MFTEQGHVSTNGNRILFELYRYRYQCYENYLQNVTVIALLNVRALDSKNGI